MTNKDENNEEENPPILYQPELDNDTDPNGDDENIDDNIELKGVNANDSDIENPEVEDDGEEETEHAAESEQTTTAHEQHNLRPKRRQQSYSHMFKFKDDEDLPTTLEEPMGDLLMNEKMSLKHGLRKFGNDGANAVINELKQLDYLDAIKPVHSRQVTGDQKRASLRYLMYLKQKRCGRVKARGRANGQKQRIYKSKEETSSPMVSIQALFLTSIIDAQEGRDVATASRRPRRISSPGHR
jgi:hypothetical protein